jgi:hypothetical protein
MCRQGCMYWWGLLLRMKLVSRCPRCRLGVIEAPKTAGSRTRRVCRHAHCHTECWGLHIIE